MKEDKLEQIIIILLVITLIFLIGGHIYYMGFDNGERSVHQDLCEGVGLTVNSTYAQGNIFCYNRWGEAIRLKVSPSIWVEDWGIWRRVLNETEIDLIFEEQNGTNPYIWINVSDED